MGTYSPDPSSCGVQYWLWVCLPIALRSVSLGNCPPEILPHSHPSTVPYVFLPQYFRTGVRLVLDLGPFSADRKPGRRPMRHAYLCPCCLLSTATFTSCLGQCFGRHRTPLPSGSVASTGFVGFTAVPLRCWPHKNIVDRPIIVAAADLSSG